MDPAPTSGLSASGRRRPWQAERLAATALFSDNAQVAGQEAADLAFELAGAGRRTASIDLVASSLALAKVQEGALAALVAALVQKRDLRTAREMAKVLKVTTERVAILARTLASIEPQPRCTVVVAAGEGHVAVGIAREGG